MPIYEYQCKGCDHKFEILQKLSDGLLKVCPECNEEKLRKLVTAAAFQLKGTGWYVTDFKDKKPRQKAGNGEDKPATGDKAGTDDGAKSAETGETKSTETKSSESKASSESKKPKPTSSSD